jgi:hypothetical protein
MKEIDLWSGGPDGPVTSKSKDYSAGGYPWIVVVRADSVSEALELLSNQTAAEGDGAGVISIDRSEGPPKVWPWDMDKKQVAPQWS